MKYRTGFLGLLTVVVFIACPGSVKAATYSATAQIEFQPRAISGLPSMANEIECLKSPDFLSPVIRQMKLDEVWAKRLGQNQPLPMKDAVNHLIGVLKLESVPNTDVLKITASSEVPQEAADIANHVADRYKMTRDVEQDQVNTHGVTTLQQEIAVQKKTLETAQAKAKQDADAEKEAEAFQANIEVLQGTLNQDIDGMKHQMSPVRILSRAAAPSA